MSKCQLYAKGEKLYPITKCENIIMNDGTSLSTQLEHIILEKATKVEVDVLKERMNGFTRLEEGSTTGDAELIDGRIGADGVKYSNIGSNIRNVDKKTNELNNFLRVKNNNILNPDTLIKGQTLYTWDVESKTVNNCTYSDANAFVTPPIKCNSGEIYKTLKINTTATIYISVMYFNEEGNYVLFQQNKSTLIVPENATQMILSFANEENTPSCIALVESEDETPVYVEYGYTLNLVSKEEYSETKQELEAINSEIDYVKINEDGDKYKDLNSAIDGKIEKITNIFYKKHSSKNILPPTEVNNKLIGEWLTDFDSCTYSSTGAITTDAININSNMQGKYLKLVNKDNTIASFSFIALFCNSSNVTTFKQSKTIQIPTDAIKVKFSFANKDNMADAIIICDSSDETPVYDEYGDKVIKNYVEPSEIEGFNNEISYLKNNINLLEENTEQPLDNIDKTGGYANIFRKVGIIGDSLSSGAQDTEGGNNAFDYWEHSWAKYMSRTTGCELVKLCKGGLQCANWHEVFETTTLNENNKCDCYIMFIGHNDDLSGDISDVDVDNLLNSNTDTMYGRYARIIGTLRTASPGAKIFCVTYPIVYVERSNKNKLIREVAEKLNCYLIDLWEYDVNKKEFKENWEQTSFGSPEVYKAKIHYTPLGYLKWSWEIMSYIDYIIRHNVQDFTDVGYINTGHTFD